MMRCHRTAVALVGLVDHYTSLDQSGRIGFDRSDVHRGRGQGSRTSLPHLFRGRYVAAGGRRRERLEADSAADAACAAVRSIETFSATS